MSYRFCLCCWCAVVWRPVMNRFCVLPYCIPGENGNTCFFKISVVKIDKTYKNVWIEDVTECTATGWRKWLSAIFNVRVEGTQNFLFSGKSGYWDYFVWKDRNFEHIRMLTEFIFDILFNSYFHLSLIARVMTLGRWTWNILLAKKCR